MSSFSNPSNMPTLNKLFYTCLEDFFKSMQKLTYLTIRTREIEIVKACIEGCYRGSAKIKLEKLSIGQIHMSALNQTKMFEKNMKFKNLKTIAIPALQQVLSSIKSNSSRTIIEQMEI